MAILFATLVFSGYASSGRAFATPVPEEAGRAEQVVQGPVLKSDGSRTHSLATPADVLALTFVGGPDPYWTPRILETLRRHGAKATFFVRGSRVNDRPDLARQIIDEGHELGAYTFSGADPGTLPGWQSTAERGLTQAAIATATGQQVRLFHPSLSSTPAEVNDRTLAEIRRATADNYTSVLADRDTRDWAGLETDAIIEAARPDPGSGAVVLMHDADGDRAHTVAALDRLVPALTARGYRFTTVSTGFQLAGTSSAAGMTGRLRGLVLQWWQWLGGEVTTWFSWMLAVATLLETTRLVVQLWTVAIHLRRSRRLERTRGGRPVTAPVTVLVPAFNEAVGIEAAVRSLVASTHPDVEVIVVDDGSADDTADIVGRLDLPGVRLIRQANGGKAVALTTGIGHASHDLIVMVDGDTVFQPDTITRLVQPFADPRVGAVSGNTKVGNRGGLLGRWQHLEYVVAFNLDRRMFDVAECMPTVPGAAGAFRRELLVQLGGVSDDTLAEDTDLTMAICRAGWRVVYEPSAIAWTEVPSSWSQLWRQRYRWTYGTSQAMWKHRRALIEPGAGGKLGRRGLLYLLLYRYFLPLISPAVDVLLVYSLIFTGLQPLSPVFLAPLATQVLTAAWSLRLDRERIWSVWALPLQLVAYRQMMYLLLIQSLVTALLGARLRWHRMHRTGMSAQISDALEPSGHA